MTDRIFAGKCDGLGVRSIASEAGDSAFSRHVSARAPNPSPDAFRSSRRDSRVGRMILLFEIKKFIRVEQHPAELYQSLPGGLFPYSPRGQIRGCLAINQVLAPGRFLRARFS